MFEETLSRVLPNKYPHSTSSLKYLSWTGRTT